MTAGVAEYGASMSAETQAVMDLAYKALNFESSARSPRENRPRSQASAMLAKHRGQKAATPSVSAPLSTANPSTEASAQSTAVPRGVPSESAISPVSIPSLDHEERTKLLNKVQSEIADEIKQLRQKVALDASAPSVIDQVTYGVAPRRAANVTNPESFWSSLKEQNSKPPSLVFNPQAPTTTTATGQRHNSAAPSAGSLGSIVSYLDRKPPTEEDRRISKSSSASISPSQPSQPPQPQSPSVYSGQRSILQGETPSSYVAPTSVPIVPSAAPPASPPLSDARHNNPPSPPPSSSSLPPRPEGATSRPEGVPPLPAPHSAPMPPVPQLRLAHLGLPSQETVPPPHLNMVSYRSVAETEATSTGEWTHRTTGLNDTQRSMGESVASFHHQHQHHLQHQHYPIASKALASAVSSSSSSYTESLLRGMNFTAREDRRHVNSGLQSGSSTKRGVRFHEGASVSARTPPPTWSSEPVHVLHPTHVSHRGISSGSMYKSMDASSSSARNLAERQHYEAFFNEYGGIPANIANAKQQHQGGQQPRSAAATANVRDEKQLPPRVDVDVAANRTAVAHISWDPAREEGSLFEVQTKGGRDRAWRTAWVGSLTSCKLSGLLQGTKYSVRIRKVSANGGVWSEEAVFDTPKSANNDMSINSRSLNSSMNYGSMKYGAPAGSLSMNASISYESSTQMMNGYAGHNSSMINDRCARVWWAPRILFSLFFFPHLVSPFRSGMPLRVSTPSAFDPRVQLEMPKRHSGFNSICIRSPCATRDAEEAFGFHLHPPRTFSPGSRNRPSQNMAADQGIDG